MVNLQLRKALLMAALACSMSVKAQQSPPKGYDPVAAFAPISYAPVSQLRTAAGTPGAGYWQNNADYSVAITLDTLTRGVKGSVAIKYANNSPDTLSYLWVLAGQNRFRADSRETQLTPPTGSRFGITEYTEGCVIESLMADKRPATFEVNGNFIRVELASPLAPGKTIRLDIAYHFILPAKGGDFMGVLETKHGGVYQYSSVFPRMCVYDDQTGWNTHASQYYVETGSIDMRITAPANMIVQGTGLLENPEDLLSPAVLRRYKQAAGSDTAIRVRTAGEPVNTKGNGMLTWHFREPRAGDGIWAASAAFNWDALSTKLPDGRSIPVMALYPPGSHAEWDTSATAMRNILQAYCQQWPSYPYSSCVNIAGSITGVASPGVSVLHYKESSSGATVWLKTNHELGHAWFNLMVAADSRHGWMCEGQNVLINHLNSSILGCGPPFEIENAAELFGKGMSRVPVSTRFGSMPQRDMGVLIYMKPAYALLLLRNTVLGPARFDDAFRRYIASWSFRHPTPDDFYRAMENAAGEDLSWFWRAWFLTDAQLDQGILQAQYAGQKPANGILITLVNKREMPMPVDLLVREFNGKSHRVKLPVQVWEWNDKHQLKVATTSPVQYILLDPDNQLPDTDRSNNIWTGSGTSPLNKAVSGANEVVDRYLNAIGGKAKIAGVKSVEMEYTGGQQNSLVWRQRYRAGGEGSWRVGLETKAVRLTLKQIDVADSIQFQQLGQPVPVSAAGADEIRRSTEAFPELRFFDKGNRVKLSDSLHFVHGMETYQITVTTPAGNNWRYYYDRATGLKVREEFAGRDVPQVYALRVFSGYEMTGGILWPKLVYLQEEGGKTDLFERTHFSTL